MEWQKGRKRGSEEWDPEGLDPEVLQQITKEWEESEWKSVDDWKDIADGVQDEGQWGQDGEDGVGPDFELPKWDPNSRSAFGYRHQTLVDAEDMVAQEEYELQQQREWEVRLLHLYTCFCTILVQDCNLGWGGTQLFTVLMGHGSLFDHMLSMFLWRFRQCPFECWLPWKPRFRVSLRMFSHL